MGLLGLMVNAAVKVGIKPLGRATGKGIGALTSPLSTKAANTPLISATFTPFATVGFGLGVGRTGRIYRFGGVGKARNLEITYGQAGQVGGFTGQTLTQFEKDSENTYGPNTGTVLLLEEGANLVGAKAGAAIAGGTMSGNYFKSMGPLLAAEGMTYGATGLLSQTEFGQDLGFKEPMGFTEMNFETGKNLGTAMLNIEVEDGERTFGEKSKDIWDKAEDRGSTWNPANYEWDSAGDALASTGTYLVGNLVTKPLGFLNVLD